MIILIHQREACWASQPPERNDHVLLFQTRPVVLWFPLSLCSPIVLDLLLCFVCSGGVHSGLLLPVSILNKQTAELLWAFHVGHFIEFPRPHSSSPSPRHHYLWVNGNSYRHAMQLLFEVDYPHLPTLFHYCLGKKAVVSGGVMVDGWLGFSSSTFFLLPCIQTFQN